MGITQAIKEVAMSQEEFENITPEELNEQPSMMEDAKTFAELEHLEKQRKDELDAVKEEKKEIEARLLERMQDEGFSKLTIEVGGKNGVRKGKRTIYLHREVWAGYSDVLESQEDRLKLHQALREVDWGDIVKETVNTRSLSSYVRQYDDKDDPKSPSQIIEALPTQLQSVIKVSEKYSVRSRKAK